MKVISIVVGYSLELAPIRNRIAPIVNDAIKNKYNVNILTSGTSKLDIDNELISYEYCNIKKELPINFIARGITEFYFSYLIMRRAYKNNSDFVLITIPNIFNLLFCKSLKKPNIQILDIRDLSWEYLESKNFIQRIVKIFFRFIFKVKMNKFDAISCSNLYEYNYVKKYRKNNQQNIILYTNGIGSSQFDDLRSLKNKIHKKNKITISYIGNLGVAQNLSILVKAANQFQELSFNIVGNGKEFLKLKQLSKNKKNITFYGRLKWEELLKIYSETDILYAQLSNNFSSAMPSKLYEYLSSGKYIIYGGDGQAKKILNSFDNNCVIKSDNVKELSNKLEEVIKNNYYKRISKSNQDKIYNLYLREKAVKRLFEFISNKK